MACEICVLVEAVNPPPSIPQRSCEHCYIYQRITEHSSRPAERDKNVVAESESTTFFTEILFVVTRNFLCFILSLSRHHRFSRIGRECKRFFESCRKPAQRIKPTIASINGNAAPSSKHFGPAERERSQLSYSGIDPFGANFDRKAMILSFSFLNDST